MTISPFEKAYATFKYNEPISDIPDLQKVAYIDHHRHEIRAGVHLVEYQDVIDILVRNSLNITSQSLSVSFADDFWDKPPEDCVGGFLWPDGWVSLGGNPDRCKIISIDNPAVIYSRPDADTGTRGRKPHVLNHVGGLPTLSERLIAVLRKIGVDGKSADIMYCGNNIDAHDTIQKGYKRFFVQPVYQAIDEGPFDVLPEEVPEDFEVCTLHQSRSGRVRYELALSRDHVLELRQMLTSVILNPLFSYHGFTHRWVRQFNDAADAVLVKHPITPKE